MSTMIYKGFEIEAASSHLRSGEWTVQIQISIERDGNTLTEPVMPWRHFQRKKKQLVTVSTLANRT